MKPLLYLAALIAFGCCGWPPPPPGQLCPRHGAVRERVHEAYQADPGHETVNEQGARASVELATCPRCGELTDEFTEEEDQGFLQPIRVYCETTKQMVTLKRDETNPFRFICPACGKPVALHKAEAR